ncbi:hypothetical protein P3T23_007551 [Paraburkholderia sp. GAS448]
MRARSIPDTDFVRPSMCVRCVDDAACEAHEEQLESLPQTS